MKLLWKCTWPDGINVSFVLARTQNEAIAFLDELGVADASMLEVIDHRAKFFVSFAACYESHEGNGPEPHWHATDENSEDLWSVLGDPPAPEPPPPPEPEPDDDPLCAKCGHARFASVHHPAYTKPNKCDYEAPAQAEPPPAEVGPERPTSE